ncbi:Pr6Pr family membrane protein [Mucilaginibacter sp. cycad4]|uniref:Pr6Pr family membrane protein n=1 Tax=Mucilaginibacter sp. cycad4 TaxID=3342096 RepID=UPI002AAA7E44|nr:Pr6Pr family membrane protein [Mucilaginibacter gossypii]WPV02813.1 Pr6Pr family membrane protein [Mucilaginibacter gossypii]
MEQYQLPINDTGKGRKWLYIFTIIIWFSLVLQITISIPAYLKAGRSLAGTLVQLFSYFTILTNLLAAICLAAVLFKINIRLGKYFSQSHVFSAIALYITIVGMVYNLVLRSLWHPEGLFKLADELLHSVNPFLFVVYWLIYMPKANLKWAQALIWLWFPFIYSVYIFIRGSISHLYPYPFLDLDKLGLPRVAINSLLMLIAFLFIGFLFVWINRVMVKRGS